MLRAIKARWNDRRYVFSLHSKIIMYTSALLVFGFAVLFWILEHNNTLGTMTFTQGITNALFHGVTLRSAGILAVPIAQLHIATIFCILILAFIGSAPGSTGSGIKVTTLAIFLATVKAAVSGRTSVEIRGRSIAKEQVYKAVAIVSLSIAWIAFCTLCLLITEPTADFVDLFFETISGFSNLGLSTGITPFLSTLGKFFIMISMVIGRIGSLTLIFALKFQSKPETSGFSYPEERVMLS
jgi:trk system potassium uptake protein TrkH